MTMAEGSELLLKSLLLGDSGVGKTCILARHTEDTFTTSFIATIGLDIKLKTYQIDGQRIKMQIWDTAGQERFRTITTSYYRGAMGVMLVFDITNEKSFDSVANWMKEIEANSSSDMDKLLVGNKCDLESKRVIPYSRAEEIAAEYNIKYIETSARTNHNIAEAFEQLAGQIAKRFTKNVPSITLQEQAYKSSKCQC